MHRSHLLLSALIFGSLAQFTAAATAGDQPNIVFIFSDDHAVQAISAYGGILQDAAPTPNLDRLAKEGALFQNSFCANSICGPSRACILTGKHSHVNGFLNNERARFDGSQTTFPKLMQGAGYETAVIGKWHLVSNPTGFDYWEVLPGQGSYYNPHLIQMDGGRKQFEGYCTDIITDHALEWLEGGRDKSKPFVLMCQHKAPHRNWSPATRHLTLFDDIEMPEPASLFDDYANRSVTLKQQAMSIANDFHWGHDMKFHGEPQFTQYFAGRHGNGEYRRMTATQKERWDAAYGPKNKKLIAAIKSGELSGDAVTRWKYQRYIKDYLRCIRAVDENVGRVLQYLDDNGLAKNTVVIYSSDQGFYLGEHGWYDKRWIFEESLKMPFLIRWPGVVNPGARPAALIQNIDYAPTFLEMAGLPAPAGVQGKSFVPVLKEASTPHHEDVYYSYYGENTHRVARHDGVRSAKHKLVRFPDTDEWNLFDLEKDPHEMVSLHADPGYADVLGKMRDRYNGLRDQFGVNTATVPANRFKEKWWDDRYKAKTKEVREGGHELVFIGDSITHSWESRGKALWDEYFAPRKALNLGFSGDRTEHVLYRLLNGQFDGVRPKVAVVMIGTNNTGHLKQAPAETVSGIRRIVDLINDRSPETQILLLGVFPRGQYPDDPLRKINVTVNSELKGLADNPEVHYLDLSDVFLDDDGALPASLMPDALHPNAEGYRLWVEAMEPTLTKLGGWE